MPLISAFLYNGKRNSSSLSSSGGAINRLKKNISWVIELSAKFKGIFALADKWIRQKVDAVVYLLV